MEINQNHNINQNSNVAIEVVNLFVWYKKSYPILKNVSFKVNRGEFHGFIGPNGIGKTSTIKTIIGANKGFDGEVIVNGVSISQEREKGKIGYIPEKANFVKGLNVYRYLISMCKLSGFTSNDAKKYVDEKLEQYGLRDHKWLSPYNLSSGQIKKVMLIEALSTNPNILILDEPAANLDPSSRTELLENLKRLSDSGVTIFITSHILEEIEKYANSITILNKNGVSYSGSLKELQKKSQATTEYKYIFKKIDDAIKFGKWANKKNFNPLISQNQLEILIANESFDKDEALKYIAKSSLECEGFYENKKSLSEIFNNLIGGINA